MTTGRVLRLAAAVALLIGGLIHLDLYFDGYRSIPDIGRSFLLNAIASGVLAAAVAVRSEWFVRLAGVGLAVGTIVAFIISRQGDGLFDFREQGFEPSPQAALALIVEIAAIVLIALTFVPALVKDDTSFHARFAALGLGVAAVVLVGYGIVAANNSETNKPAEAAPGASAVTILGFAFDPPSLTVAPGTTVTWVNQDGPTHTVKNVDDSISSERLATGDEFSFTFADEGTFAYICGIHPSMKGTVVVAAG